MVFEWCGPAHRDSRLRPIPARGERVDTPGLAVYGASLDSEHCKRGLTREKFAGLECVSNSTKVTLLLLATELRYASYPRRDAFYRLVADSPDCWDRSFYGSAEPSNSELARGEFLRCCRGDRGDHAGSKRDG